MNELRTIEGAEAWNLLTGGCGQWLRAGMSGTVVGLDIEACLSRPSARRYDGEVIELLLTMAEAVSVRAMNSRQPEE